MTKRQDLCLQRRSRPEQSDQRQPNQAANISHQPRASPDSTSLASRIEFPTMTAWQKVEKTRAVLFGIAGASAVLVLPGTTTLWRCVVGVFIVIASVTYDLNRE